MENFKLQENSQVVEVTNQIFKIFDILKREKISSDEYQIILLFLSLYKEGILSKEIILNQNDIYQKIRKNIEEFDKKSTRQYFPIFKNFEDVLSSISLRGLNSIIEIITSVDKDNLSNNYHLIFDAILYRIVESQGRQGGMFILPSEIASFICNLANPGENSKVYNPFAGLASFGIYMDGTQNYLAQELNLHTWALGALRKIAYSKKDNFQYVCDDSLQNWPNKSQKFDLIIANPPFGMRLETHNNGIEPKVRTLEQFLIKRGIDSLNSKGKLIALLPQSFLFSGAYDKELREQLIKEDLIDTLISLPGGLLLNTGIPLLVLFINKEKKTPGKVRFVDAKNFIISKNKRDKILDEDELLKTLLNNDKDLESVKTDQKLNHHDLLDASNNFNHIDNESIRIITNDQIIKNDYNLNVSRYFEEDIEGVKLKNILKTYKHSKVESPVNGKKISISDLQNDNLDFKLDINKVEDSTLNKSFFRQVSKSCILVSKIGTLLKPTYFEFSGTPIFLNNNILAFELNYQTVDIAYLINELHSDYVQKQLDAYRQDIAIPHIRRDDLLEVVVKLPSIKEQKAKVQGLLEVTKKIKALETKKKLIEQGKSYSHYNELASLKHALGRPRQNILAWTDNLLDFFSKEEISIKDLNKSFSDFYERDISAVLKEIKNDVNYMTALLEKEEEDLKVKKSNETIIPLSEINKIVKNISDNGLKFKIKKLLLEGRELKERGVCGDKTLFKRLIDNLLTNADKHGFEHKNVGNEVVFELKEVDNFLTIEVRNNGKPFPKNFGRDKFITKHKTTNSKLGFGIGGYDINYVATEFENKDWELILNQDPIYPVKFKFQFPIRLIN